MNIFVIGTIDKKGGAAIVSWELRKKLKENGHTVNTYVRYKYSEETDIHVIPRKRWQDWLVKLFAYDLAFSWTDYLMDTKEFKEADIVHCHNLHSNFFDLKTLQKMSMKKPVVWTQHDIWSITGFASDMLTLHHPNKKRFLLYLWDNTPFLYWMKKRIYNKSNLHIVTVSDWQKNIFKDSILGDKDITRIYNGVDTDIFKPYNKAETRKELGLPINKKIVLAGMYDQRVSNAVIDHFIGNNDIFFIAIGKPSIKTLNKNYKVLPYTYDRTVFAKYLSSADIFMHPTYGETFGLACAEALACGTIPISTNVEAVPEVVVHEKTGYLAPYNDNTKFIECVNRALNLSQDGYRTMTENGVTYVRDNFAINKIYNEYVNLYEKLINEFKISHVNKTK